MTDAPTTLTLTRPDDWHLHLRDGAALGVTVPATAHVFARAIVMPNLVPPVTTVAEAEAYRGRILEAVPRGVAFEPLMTLYLTSRTSADEVRRAADSGLVVGCKLYPAGATTNSDAGVSDIAAIHPVLDAMQEARLPLLVHGEAVDPAIDVFDREKVFIDHHLAPLCARFADLPVVFEHVTTADAVQFVEGARAGVAATLTPHHLLMNRNDLFARGLQPHNYCLPVLKRRPHQEALRQAAIGGNPRFFLGTDSAPHARSAKEAAGGCAGCYSAPAALSLYAQVFDELGALDRLEAFASFFGADFYGRPRNTDTITLRRETWKVPDALDYPHPGGIVPYWAGRELAWRF
jgi:dihydroorotase